MSGIVRFGITFPLELFKEFDMLINKLGYKSRSQAIHNSVRLLISEYKELEEERGMKAGIITIFYNHEANSLEESLTYIQHDFRQIIISTLHVHLTERDCLEAIAVRGEARRIKQLVEALIVKRGIKLLKPMLTTP